MVPIKLAQTVPPTAQGLVQTSGDDNDLFDAMSAIADDSPSSKFTSEFVDADDDDAPVKTP